MMRLREIRKGKTILTGFLSTGLLTAGLALTPEVGRAEAPKIIVPADMHRGIVITNRGRTLKINKYEFLVSPQVVVTDRQGKRREVSDVVPGESIAFHMSKGSIDRIECNCPPPLRPR